MPRRRCPYDGVGRHSVLSTEPRWGSLAGGGNDATPTPRSPRAVPQVYSKSGALARPLGYPGPADQKVALVQSKYIIVDMFARAVQGESPEAAVAWAETEMKQVYGQ